MDVGLIDILSSLWTFIGWQLIFMAVMDWPAAYSNHRRFVFSLTNHRQLHNVLWVPIGVSSVYRHQRALQYSRGPLFLWYPILFSPFLSCCAIFTPWEPVSCEEVLGNVGRWLHPIVSCRVPVPAYDIFLTLSLFST